MGDSGSIKYGSHGNVSLATSTDNREQISDALLHAEEEESMALAQEQAEPAPKASGTYEDRVNEARLRYRDFDDYAFRKVDVYEGVKQIIVDHPNGPALQREIGRNPKLARELRDLPVHLSMARAGALADKLAREGNPHRKPAFADISE